MWHWWCMTDVDFSVSLPFPPSFPHFHSTLHAAPDDKPPATPTNSLKWTLLTVLRPRSTLSMYVLLSFHWNEPCWPSCCPIRPSVCTSFHPLTEMDPADCLAALLHPQDVCVHPVILSLKWTLLTILWPRSTLSVYILSSFHRNGPCWLSCGPAFPLACMPSCPFTEKDPANRLASSLPPQDVCPLVLSLKFNLLTILRLCSVLRMYALLSFHWNGPSWLSCILAPPTYMYFNSTWNFIWKSAYSYFCMTLWAWIHLERSWWSKFLFGITFCEWHKTW